MRDDYLSHHQPGDAVPKAMQLLKGCMRESEEDRVLRHPGAFLRALGASSSIYALPTYVVMYGPVWAQLGGATGLSRRLGVKYNACATLMDSVIPTDHGATYTVNVACRLGAEKTAAGTP